MTRHPTGILLSIVRGWHRAAPGSAVGRVVVFASIPPIYGTRPVAYGRSLRAATARWRRVAAAAGVDSREHSSIYRIIPNLRQR